MSRAGRALDSVLFTVELAGLLTALYVVLCWLSPLEAASWVDTVILWSLAAGWLRSGRKYDRLETAHQKLLARHSRMLIERAALKATAKLVARGRHL